MSTEALETKKKVLAKVLLWTFVTMQSQAAGKPMSGSRRTNEACSKAASSRRPNLRGACGKKKKKSEKTAFWKEEPVASLEVCFLAGSQHNLNQKQERPL